MKTKLRAAALATAQGINTVITNGKAPEALYEIVRGNKVGTLFVEKRSRNSAVHSNKAAVLGYMQTAAMNGGFEQ